MKQGGTGGANTNRGGLKFEASTDLAAHIVSELADQYELKEHVFKESLVIKSTSKVFDVYRKVDKKMIGIITKQYQFYNVLKEIYHLDNVNKKKWKPDEVFFNLEANTVFIVEKKWQQGAGSVDEKIFGFVNKRRLYQNNFNALEEEQKPTVEFSALFNSSWWIYGIKDDTGTVTLESNPDLPRKNEKAYQDYFDNLRIDGIKIFFDKYDYWWFGL
ncbi:PD-(D/E)XK nuclease superfamily protein [Lactiplantibacillus plantarum]|uniref:PD-(D/E)XK nuclease superfamily protein n=1 Tax=Lactiplantibacillus plantarum TaxID=1590 RepID=UPI001CC97F77|nr:PD-(D/E)XK nuclease superfamily protein [Lactiplantibacillus plantarum]